MNPAHPDLKSDFESRKRILEDPKDRAALAALIDHTLLKMDAQERHIQAIADEARIHRFRAVCVAGSSLEILENYYKLPDFLLHKPRLCTVIGFPHGNTSSRAKISEISAALALGAEEFDYVQNVGWVRDGHWNKLTVEAQKIVAAAQGKLVKVILETSLLSEEELYNSALAAAQGGVHILKTSTGFGTRGATKNDLDILARVQIDYKKNSNIDLGIKASGGIRSLTDALTMIQLGATRLGTSSGVILVSGLTSPGSDNY